jgi:hypothetical protein
MQVDYLLYHEDHKKIEGILKGLTDRPDGLFDPRWRSRMHVTTSGNGSRWSDVTPRSLRILGTNILQYNVTPPSTHPYPELVSALLSDKDWQVKVRYRNTTVDDPWTYMKCEFPEDIEYALPVGWQE